MRTYEKTHPWLTFALDLNRLPVQTWMLLGEARSKCEHLAGVPLRPETAHELNQVYLAKGVLATTAIEGNTLSEDEVRQHLAGKLKLPPSKRYLAREIDNVLGACNGILRDVALDGKPLELTRQRIEKFNELVLAGLDVGEEVTAGQIRTHSVGVADYRGAPAADCAFLLDRLCEWLGEAAFQPNADIGVVPAILSAVVAHLYLAWIHPFGDGNGRTARLLEYAILVSAGVPMPAAHLLSNHYNETRARYYRQLAYASQSKGDVTKFITYAVQGFVDGLKAQIDLIRRQQLDVAWRNFVHEQFRDHSSEAGKRRRELVLDLSDYGDGVDHHRLLQLSPVIARAYANRTPKTLTRDLGVLRDMGLVELLPQGRVRARQELIEAFLPPRRTHEPVHSNAGRKPRSPRTADTGTTAPR